MRILNFLFTTSLVFALASCYPKGPEYIDELDIAVTDKSATYDFAAKKTFYLYDSITWVTNDLTFKPDRSFDVDILKKVAQNMEDRNYVQMDTLPDTTNIANPANPDLLLTVAGIYTNNTGTTWVPIGGWGWGWGWGWGGGWGGWVPTTYSYTIGTLIVDMGDFKTGDKSNQTFTLVWEGAVNGVAESRVSSNQQRILNGVDQIFTQSPYILSN